MPLKRLARVHAAAGLWSWIVMGVAWGLLCVGVRHAALRLGVEMEGLVADRQAAVDRLQALEREAATARRFGRVEALAADAGFVKPQPRQLVIAAPEAAAPSWTSWWAAKPAAAPAPERPELRIRPRDQVVVADPAAAAKPARPKPGKGKHPHNKKKRRPGRTARPPAGAAAP